MADNTSIPIIVQGNSFSLAIPLQIYVIDDNEMVLEDYTPDPTDEVTIQLKGSRRNYTYTPTIEGNIANIDLGGYELADNYAVVVSIVKQDGKRLRSFRTDQFFIVESSDDLTQDDIIEGLEENVIYLNAQAFIAGADGRGIESIVKTSTAGLVDTYTITYTDATTSTFQVTNGQDANVMGVVKNYTTDDLISNYYIRTAKSVGETVDLMLSTSHTYGVMVVDVKVGDILTISTQGGTFSRAYCVTDKSRKVLVVSAAGTDTTSNPIDIHIDIDGYVFINCAIDAYANFYVKHQRSMAQMAMDEVERANAYAINLEEFGVSSLSSGFFRLSDGIGSTIASTPTANSDWTYLCVPIKKGERVKITTMGGNNARAYGLTNESRELYLVANAAADYLTTPAEITAEVDGFLYVHSSIYYAHYFRVEKCLDVPQAINNTSSSPYTSTAVSKYKNNPLPFYRDTLRVLAIANSFMVDGFSYLQDFIDASGIENNKICFYGCFRSSGSLSLWNDIYNNDTALSSNNATCLKYAGGVDVEISSSNTLKEILSNDWDVIIFQQVSTNSNNYSTYDPHLTKLIAHAREDCTNQQVAIGWQMTWSYKDSHPVTGPHGEDGWAGICNAVKQMMSNNGIDIIIPTGTAIQNARNSSINTNGDMTRDGAHLAYGVGRYIASSTWWQSLVAPIFGASVLGNPAIHNLTQDESSSTYDAVAVTSSNKSLCQLCAFHAVMDMFNVTLISNRTINDKVITVEPSIYDRVRGLELDKQDKLESGRNIKTINGNSVLGSGDLQIETVSQASVKEAIVDNSAVEYGTSVQFDRAVYTRLTPRQVELINQSDVMSMVFLIRGDAGDIGIQDWRYVRFGPAGAAYMEFYTTSWGAFYKTGLVTNVQANTVVNAAGITSTDTPHPVVGTLVCDRINGVVRFYKGSTLVAEDKREIYKMDKFVSDDGKFYFAGGDNRARYYGLQIYDFDVMKFMLTSGSLYDYLDTADRSTIHPDLAINYGTAYAHNWFNNTSWYQSSNWNQTVNDDGSRTFTPKAATTKAFYFMPYFTSYGCKIYRAEFTIDKPFNFANESTKYLYDLEGNLLAGGRTTQTFAAGRYVIVAYTHFGTACISSTEENPTITLHSNQGRYASCVAHFKFDALHDKKTYDDVADTFYTYYTDSACTNVSRGLTMSSMPLRHVYRGNLYVPHYVGEIKVNGDKVYIANDNWVWKQINNS